MKNMKVIQIGEKLSTKYEAAKVLREYPKDTVVLKNIEGYDIPVVSGICNTREKIAKSLNCEVSEITAKVIDGMNNPIPVTNFIDLKDEYTTKRANLDKIPILTHYKRDGGAYITAGVVFAKDPETGVQNASIHRMMVIDKNHLAIRLVPRNLYTYFHKAEEMGKDLDIAIAIGMEPSTLLASTTSIPIDADEMEVANAFKDGELTLVNCANDLKVPDADIILEGKLLAGERAKEGPFVDLTDTYDLIRDEPVIKLTKMHFKENAMYHAILPAGFEHKLLQGLPQEPRIFNAVKNTVPTLQNVVLTEGGCCWLHAAVSIKKQTQGDGKNVIMAALAAHPSLKHVVVVDEDVDIFDPQDIEYAIATRVKGDDDIIIIPKARGSSLDPVASEEDGTTTKVGIDATKSILEPHKFERVSFSE
ncbi:MAG: UbiD family decarboxylase [Methanobacteriaceae archaeon]|nr:UbiD family decarboxylase [Methanobacteriaceae archaeon]